MLGSRAKVGRANVVQLYWLIGHRRQRCRVVLHLLQVTCDLYSIGTGSQRIEVGCHPAAQALGVLVHAPIMARRKTPCANPS